jgi:Hemolysin activation/secretion protein
MDIMETKKRSQTRKVLRSKWLLVAILLTSVSSTSVLAAPPSSLRGFSDPGSQLNRDRESLERQKVLESFQEMRERNLSPVEDQREEEKTPAESQDVKISLTKVVFSESVVLTDLELANLTEKYEGRDVTVQELYDLVNQVNELYSQKGYLVCLAILPEQTIKDGVVSIVLIEGKTGEVQVQGNKTTHEGYIKSRTSLNSGEVSNIKKLNRELIWFNGTNNVQLQVEIRAGKAPGTSDYIIRAYEPKRHVFSLYTDNAGSDTSGEWRGGFGYTHRSVTGNRDDLFISGLFSEGVISGGINYSMPITKKGTRLSVNYNANKTEIVNGVLDELAVNGESQLYGVNITHPFKVSSHLQVEGFAEFQRQQSSTTILGMDWVDDSVRNSSSGVIFTHYWPTLIFYHRHAYSYGRHTDIGSNSREYNRYNFMGILQKTRKNNHILTFRSSAQWTPEEGLPSADQFYIGGAYSVRGYRENFRGDDKGFSASLEYSVPIKKAGSAFVFTDYGWISGLNGYEDRNLQSAGIGFRWNFMKQGAATLTWGVPFSHIYDSEEVSPRGRIHFSVVKEF